MSVVKTFLAVIFLISNIAFARDYQIYSISQDFPMGVPNEFLKKNFYVNMGTAQGLKEGAILDVFRNVTIVDPYADKKKYDHKVVIGKLKVIHAEEQTSITKLEAIENGEDIPYFEVANLMVGDVVDVSITR